MRKIWSADSKTILEQFTKLKDTGATFTLCLEGQKNCGVLLKTVEEKAGKYFLVFEKNGEVSVAGRQCLFFYKPTDHQTRGFQGIPEKETERFFSFLMPVEIFEVGMRRFPRVSTPNSTATFSQQGRTKLFHCKVLDVSLEGAMFCGKVSPDLKKGDVVGPLTMNLSMKFGSDETHAQIAEATVMNVISAEGITEKKVGVFFHKNAATQATLSPYIDIRLIEDSVKGD